MKQGNLTQMYLEAKAAVPLIGSALSAVIAIPFAKRALEGFHRMDAYTSMYNTFMQNCENVLYSNGMMEALGCMLIVVVCAVVCVSSVKTYLRRSGSLRYLRRNGQLNEALAEYSSPETVYFTDGVSNALGKKYVFLPQSGVVVPYSSVRWVQTIDSNYHSNATQNFSNWTLARTPSWTLARTLRAQARSGGTGIAVYCEYGEYVLFFGDAARCASARDHIKKYAPNVRID